MIRHARSIAGPSVRQAVRSAVNRTVRNVLPFEALDRRVLMTGTVVTTVFNDVNNNGVKDASDTPLAGWSVFVDYDKNGIQNGAEPGAPTNASGISTILNVDKGTWDVREIAPVGWEPASGFKLFDRASVQDNRTSNISFLNRNVGTTGNLQGHVWNDLSGEGTITPDEPGIPGWTVFLDLNESRTLDAGEPSQITDGNGFFQFLALAPATYKLRQVFQPNWDATIGFDGQNTVNVSAGNTTTSDFANFSTAALGRIDGVVWNDLNANGVRDASDPGLSAWSLYLDLDNNGVQGVAEPTTTTDATGNFSFLKTPIGTYTVREVLQPGWNVSPGFAVARTAVVAAENNPFVQFANFTPTTGTISGIVYSDINGDGSNAGDPGLFDWTVYIDENNNSSLDAGEPSAVTNTLGQYTITGVPLGSFAVRDVSKIGFKATAPATGVQTVTLLNGENKTNVNFGNQQRTDGGMHGVVFNDKNKNGVRDAGEPGLAGIPVYLDTNNNGTPDAGEPQVISSVDLFYTPGVDEAGHFDFTHLPAGTFHLKEVVPALQSATPASVRSQDVTILPGEDRTGLTFANQFRANEIHGMIFNDVNRNHVKDVGENGIAGVTVYIDLNRNNVWESGEPKTKTDVDGVYHFTTTLAPGSYVIRHLKHSSHGESYPTTTSGILWPGGVSNPAVGNVSPTSITEALAKNQSSHHSVSLTLPTTGALTNKVDVFLLFDDTGSFTGNSPIVRAAFPQIISTLQAALPGIDMGFGVGRLEEYGSFAFENATGRPFILNQPIISQDTPGFSAAIQAALDRTAPGYGGDGPETDIEALYQVATGRGFDGNNNGTTTDSGAAGLVNTQVNPGASGDVPSFDSFTVDAAGNVLAPSGSIGGAGFRPGALPIILTATDIGFAFQAKGETSITGLNGLTLPISQLTQTSRNTTPFNSGAGIQETVTALNALGALVIGLGTNAQAGIDPRQGLEALASLTGAVNHSLTTIPNGTTDPIAPGDPMYFQIASGFGASVANGIVTAIQTAVTTVDVDLEVKASDPRVIVHSTPGVITHVGAGETASFDVEFVGTGAPRRFDLQFVRAGTNVVLGSIPVVLGTPISGDYYEYDELEEGEIHHSIDFGDYEDATLPTNTAPSFTKGGDITDDNSGTSHSYGGWATGISAGPAADAGQLVDFVVSSDNPSLFADAPIVAPDGTLQFTPSGIAGTALVTISAVDTGGTFNGGADTSAPQTFRITLNVTTPLVVAAAFEYRTRQALTIDFSSDVASSLTVDDLVVTNLASGATIPLQDFAYDAATKRAVVRFNPLVLPDGNYRLTIAAGSVAGLGSAYTMDFQVLAGDANGDHLVGFDDLLVVAQNYGATAGKDVSTGDFNYDGAVNFDDLLILAQRYNGSALVAPKVASAKTVRRKPTSALPA